jgi:hypothetical protein
MVPLVVVEVGHTALGVPERSSLRQQKLVIGLILLLRRSAIISATVGGLRHPCIVTTSQTSLLLLPCDSR